MTGILSVQIYGLLIELLALQAASVDSHLAQTNCLHVEQTRYETQSKSIATVGSTYIETALVLEVEGCIAYCYEAECSNVAACLVAVHEAKCLTETNILELVECLQALAAVVRDFIGGNQDVAIEVTKCLVDHVALAPTVFVIVLLIVEADVVPLASLYLVGRIHDSVGCLGNLLCQVVGLLVCVGTVLQVSLSVCDQLVKCSTVAALCPLTGVGTNHDVLGQVLLVVDGVNQLGGINQCLQECVHCILQLLVVLLGQLIGIHLGSLGQCGLQSGANCAHLSILSRTVDGDGIELELGHVGEATCAADLRTSCIVDVEAQVLVATGVESVAIHLCLVHHPRCVDAVETSPRLLGSVVQCRCIVGSIHSHGCDVVVGSACTACDVSLYLLVLSESLVQVNLEVVGVGSYR